MFDNYSVLMSVYFKENPDFLKLSIESMFNQTKQTNDFILVCDGPLTEALEQVILKMKQNYGDIFNVVRLSKNQGLGNALNFGLTKCKNELVARMDSDDYSLPNRCEVQLEMFQKNPNLSICSGHVEQFSDSKDTITGQRRLPLTSNDIIQFSKFRNPFNHPAVMFKKSSVEKVGGYDERFNLLEDYYLWIRLLKNNFESLNINKTLVLMRTTSDMYLRRGGIKYAITLFKFNLWMKKIKWISNKELLLSAIPHCIICLLPNGIRKNVYRALHK